MPSFLSTDGRFAWLFSSETVYRLDLETEALVEQDGLRRCGGGGARVIGQACTVTHQTAQVLDRNEARSFLDHSEGLGIPGTCALDAGLESADPAAALGATMAKQYKNAPIEEALCEVRFDPDGWDISVPGRVYERLRNTYDAPVVPQHRMRIAASGPNVTVDAERDAAMLISNAAGSQRVRLGEAAISVHVVRPYPGWTRLQPALSEALKAYRDVAQPKRASRIGVRYINRIQIPVDRPFEVSDYVRVGRVTPEEFPAQTSSIFHRVEHLYDDGIKLIFAFATLATEKGSALLLDLDVIREAEIAADDVLSVVDALHEREGEAFEALVTDEARRIFNDG